MKLVAVVFSLLCIALGVSCSAEMALPDSEEGEEIEVSREAFQSVCSANYDCRTFSSYCGTCACRALSARAREPVCRLRPVSCFVDPCDGRQAICVRGQCRLTP